MDHREVEIAFDDDAQFAGCLQVLREKSLLVKRLVPTIESMRTLLFPIAILAQISFVLSY